ncbi:MAG: hypothetical protein CMD87_06000 [Gammaproteobacteria bacterium]|nr:hypothetical protein [Gammaproteobacteria bacterium]
MDMNQLLQALRNADAAGDTAAASRIAQMIQQQRQPAAAPEQPSVIGTLGKGMMDRVYAMGEGITDFMPTVNKALTGYENPRLYLPTGDDGFQFSDLKNMRMMDEKDLPSGNVNPLGFTGKEFENAADYLAKNRKALNYQPLTPWNEVKSNPTPQNVLAFMGEAAVTSLPDMAAAMISAPAYFASYVSPIAEKRAENDGRTQVTPEDLAVAAVAAAGIATAERFGAKGVFGQNVGNAAQRVVGAGARESGTEAIQNPLQYAAETVGTEAGFDPVQAADQAAAGAVGGFGAGTGLRTGTELATAGGLTAPDDMEAAGNLARRLDATAKNNDFNTGNVSQPMNPKGARALLDDAHVSIAEEIKTEETALGKSLKPDAKTDTEETKRLKNLAKTGLRNARNKTKGTVTREQFNAVDQLVGNTSEGQRLLSLMREGNELTALHNQGLKGGVSRVTDLLNPLELGQGYAVRKAIEAPAKLALTGGLFAVNPALTAAQAGAVVGGRAIDALTGKRSNVANYIRQNRDNTGVRETQSPSVRAALDAQNQDRTAARETQEKLDRQDFEANRPVTNMAAPVGQVFESTGLDRQQQVAVAERMAQMPEHQDIKPQLEQLIKSVKGTNQRVDNIRNIIARIAEEVQKQGIAVNNQTSGGIPRLTIPVYPEGNPLDAARRQQGIDDNRARIDTLRRQVAGDQDISANDRSLVEDALRDLTLDLGRNPVEAAERIVNGAAALADNKGNVTKYLNKYLDRVRQQQSGKKFETSADQPVGELFTAEAFNDPMRISPRRPTAVRATEDALAGEPLQIGSDAILNSDLGGKLLPKVMNYLGIKGERQKGDNRPDDQIFVDHIKNNLLHLYKSVSPEYRERARQWYVGANRLSQQAADKYGLALHQVAGVMASLSPQKDWYMNYDLGIRTLDAYNQIKPTDIFDKKMASAFRRMIKKQNPLPQKMLKLDLKNMKDKQFQEMNSVQKAIFIRFWDEVNNPEGGHRVITPEGDLIDFQMTTKGEKSGTAWNGFGDIKKAINIIENGSRENIDEQLGMMHKVRSFYNNILSPMSDQGDVTIDTHAVAAGHLRPFSGNHQEVMENFKAGGKSSITGAVGSYGLYAEAYRQAAAEAGVLPREMQSITWEAVRGLFTPAYKGQKKNQETIANIWKRYDAGDITIDQARQEIFDAAGGINRAAWEGQGRDNPAPEGAGSSSDTRDLSGDSLSRAGDRRRVGSEPSRPLLRTAEGINEDQDTELRINFDNDALAAATASDLISRLTKSLKRSGEETIDKAMPKAVKLLDPEGRETASLVQAGLNGRGLSAQEIETIFPQLVQAFDFIFSGPLGRYSSPTNNVGDGKIEMRPISNIGGRSWLDTFMHELGHAIEEQSGLRYAVGGLKETQDQTTLATSKYEDGKTITPEDRAKGKELLKKLEAVSRERRPQHWQSIDKNMAGLLNTSQKLGVSLKIPNAMEFAYMGEYSEFTEFAEQYLQQMFDNGHDMTEMSTILPQMKRQLEYVYKPAELSADALAMYMTSPDYMKKHHPEVAAYVRRFVNNSPVSKFITFHSIAAMVGAAGMTSLLMGMDGDEEEKGILSLGSGALSSAA